MSTWTDEHQASFERDGFARLPGAFSVTEAAEMEERVWRFLERRFGARRDDPTTWNVPLVTGLQSLRTHGVFDPIGGPALTSALDALIGEGVWQRPKHWGQFLVNFPTDEAGEQDWRAGWHTDFPYFLPPDRVIGALVFSFVGAVPPRSGGTLVVAGSPRVVRAFLEEKPHLRKTPMKTTRKALLASDPWLRSISEATGATAAERVIDAAGCVRDVPVRVLELTGEPGDIVLCHPWMLHAGNPNQGDRPRFMRVQRIAPPLRSAKPS